MTRPSAFFVRFAVASAFFASACSSGNGGIDAGTDAAARDSVVTPDTLGPNPDGGLDGGRPTDLIGIAITPRTAQIVSTDGSMPTQPFQVVGTHRDGTQVPVTNAVWTLSDDTHGAVAGDGTFTANGVAGGDVNVLATAVGTHGEALSATATLTVLVHRTILGTGVPASAPTTFSTAPVATAAAASPILYPLDGAFMPDNVAPPDVQWDTGNANDLYRIHVQVTGLDVTAYVLHTGAAFTYDWPIDPTAWRSVAETNPGTDVSITLDRLDAASGQIVLGTPVHVRLSRQSIHGVVYYWAISAGRMERLDADTSTRTNFMPNPPSGCVACHQISRDGRYLAGGLDGSPRTLAVFDLTQDLTASPAPTVFPSTQAFPFPTFSPDDSLILATGFGSGIGGGDGSDGFALFDAHTGATVASNGLPTDQHVTHAEWSPDGHSVVYTGNITGSYSGYASHFTSSDLLTMSVTGTAPPLTFGAPQILHHGSDLASDAVGGTVDDHPTWSPDAQLIAFQHSVEAYSQFNANGAIFVIVPSSTAAVRLDHAMGGTTGTSAFWPTFSPFVTNEGPGVSHYWLAYFSQRDYGNAQVGTRGSSRRQLWVTAIQTRPSGGDPSSVPYWLPGQDPATENAAARWAPTPCRANGTDCTVNSECCSGQCTAGTSAPPQLACQPPPATQCRHEGQLCGGNGDCCNGLMCAGNVCTVPPG